MSAVETCRGVGATSTDLIRDLVAAGYAIGPAEPFTVTVFDTFDGRLHDAGLRLDHVGAELVLHDSGGRTARTVVDAVPRFATDLPPGPFRARLAELLDVRALLPVATVGRAEQRAERRNSDAKLTSVVTIHLELCTDGRPVDGWLVSVEELTGYAKAADDARDVVGPHVTEPVDGDAVASILSAAGIELGGRHVDPGIALDAEIAAIEGFRLVLANLAEAIEVNRPGTIEDLDSEFLHDLRVAVRRTRSILRHGRAVLPPDVLAWAEPGLKQVGDVTGPPRDLDVQVLEWDAAVADLDDRARQALEPLRRLLVHDRDEAHARLAEQLGAGDVTNLLHRWRDVLQTPMDPATGGPRAGDALLDVVRTRVRKAQRRLLEHGRAITPDTPAEHVHDVRKDAKKLRYLLECFADLFPAEGRKAFVKRLKRLQDLLGAHQDADVHADELRRAAERLPLATGTATYVAIGQLVEHLERTRQAARDGFADRFAEYDSKQTRRILTDLLRGEGE
jgi:CHAD domain-containing protein